MQRSTNRIAHFFAGIEFSHGFVQFHRMVGTIVKDGGLHLCCRDGKMADEIEAG